MSNTRKKRKKSHRSPTPKAAPTAQPAAKREGGFPIWGTGFLAANLGMVLQGGVVPTALAVVGCLLDLLVLNKPLPGEKKLIFCVLILAGSWVALIAFTLAYQQLYA